VADRLVNKLKEQMDFIRTSCELFDARKPHEAIRIGTPIRTLFHETRNCKSLLGQLNARNIQLLTTISDVPRVPGKVVGMCFDPVFTITLSGPVLELTVPSGDSHTSVDGWWQQPVLIHQDGRRNIIITRETVVLHTVDKEGGAHVDPDITQQLEFMMNDGSKMVFRMGQKNEIQIPIVNKHLALLRRFGFELLNSRDLKALAGIV
jgi:hypothetical protein